MICQARSSHEISISMDFFFNWPVRDESEAYEISVLFGKALGQQVTFSQRLTLEFFENSVLCMALTSSSYWYFTLKLSRATQQF